MTSGKVRKKGPPVVAKLKRGFFCGAEGPLTQEHVLPEWLRHLGLKRTGVRERCCVSSGFDAGTWARWLGVNPPPATDGGSQRHSGRKGKSTGTLGFCDLVGRVRSQYWICPVPRVRSSGRGGPVSSRRWSGVPLGHNPEPRRLRRYLSACMTLH